MIITIDTTQPLSPEDRELIAAVIGFATVEVAGPAPAAKATPAKKAAAPAKKAAAKPAPASESDEDEEEEPEEDSAPTTKDALERATAVMDEHGAEPVRTALAAVKVQKVGQLKPTQVAKFLEALDEAVANGDSVL